jgi:hypothetical protein
VRHSSVELFSDNKTQLILEKIKLEEKPEYKNFLHSYFNDPSKYFVKKFKDSPVIVGKKYNKNTSFKIKFDIKGSPKRKIKKNFINKSIIDHKKNSSSDNSSGEKNNGGDIQKESNNLKPGQRYVDDLEINEIFTNFKNTQKANKKKINNNIKINDIRKFRAENMEKSKTIKSRLLMRKKTIKLLKGLNPLDINDIKNNINLKSPTEPNVSNNNSNNNSIKKTSTKKLIDSLKKKDSEDSSFPNIQCNKNITNNNNLLKIYQNNINNCNDKSNTLILNESMTPKSNNKINNKKKIFLNLLKLDNIIQ